jgi:hypothetical protein
MYIFVFLWTPVLSPGGPPLGLTFASFMGAIMGGSSLYRALAAKHAHASLLQLALALMAASQFVAVLTTATNALYASYLAFLVLELACGLYFPTIGRMR